MQVHNTNNISFGTNIKFLSPKDFKKIKKTFSVSSKIENYILHYDIIENSEETKLCYRLNKPSCITTGIITCVGIAVTDRANKKASFFAHFFHSEDIYKKISLIKDYLKGNNAIIIGQRKDKYEASSKIFEKLKSFCKTNNIPTTTIRGLKKGYESDMAYYGENDTLFICVSNIYNNEKYVNNPKNLKRVFSDISIAPCDKIEFLKHDSIKRKSFLVRIFKRLFKSC